MERYDLAVVGGGLVGLATAYEVLRRRPPMRVALLEKEADLALHQSRRNSGVVHSGIYYRPGSLKAHLCREGKALLEPFAAEHGVPYRACGKLIVAVEPEELRHLRVLAERAVANGVRDVRELVPGEIRELEPHITGIRALYSPSTAITDFRKIALALGKEIRELGGSIFLRRRLLSIEAKASGRLLRTARGPIVASFVVSCAGLQSDRVAAMESATRDQLIIPFRGSYYRLRQEAKGLVQHLIYPVPDPKLPFLGVHFTPRIDGDVWAGPSAVVALAREGASPWQVNVGDVASMLAFPGFWRLAGNHWRMSLGEIHRDVSKVAFLRACQQYLPELRSHDLLRGPFGVRAQAVTRDGSLHDDFSLSEQEGIIHVLNAPSPAATASLAIGRFLGDRIIARTDARGNPP